MSSDHPAKIDSRLLAAYVDGEVTASEASAVERAEAESAHARRTLRQLTELRDALSRPRAELERIDLSDRVFAALRAPRKPDRGRPWRQILPAIAVAACVVLAGGFWPWASEDPSEFQARSGDRTASDASRWAGVQVYRVAEPSVPSRLTQRLARGDGLLFSYTNLGPRPFEYLMIFAVDSAKNVRWFHPAYQEIGTDPKAMPIQKGQSQVALTELIQQDFEPGPLSIYALFTREALTVSKVEHWVAASKGELSLPLANSSLQEIRTEVVP